MTSSSRPIRCGVVGVGRMGNHHARVYAQMENVELVGVVDRDESRRNEIARSYETQPLAEVRQLLDAGVDAVTVAVPTKDHRSALKPLLKAGVACLIEKPLAPNVEEAQQIADLADSTGTILQVGHIERFNPAVRALRTHGDLRPRFIEVHRVSPMTFRSVDVGVVLDMMIHDLDVVLMLTGDEPSDIRASAVAVLGAAEDVCNARLEFPSGCVANITASRLALKTERKVRIVAEDAYVSIDYAKKTGTMIRRTANAEQLAALREELTAGKDLSDLDYTDLVKVEMLDVDDQDQLVMQLTDFLESVRTGRRPTVDAHAGFAAVRTAERIGEASRKHATRLTESVRDRTPV